MSNPPLAGLLLALLATGCSAGDVSDAAAPPPRMQAGDTAAPDLEIRQTGAGSVSTAHDAGEDASDSAPTPE